MLQNSTRTFVSWGRSNVPYDLSGTKELRSLCGKKGAGAGVVLGGGVEKVALQTILERRGTGGLGGEKGRLVIRGSVNLGENPWSFSGDKERSSEILM